MVFWGMLRLTDSSCVFKIYIQTLVLMSSTAVRQVFFSTKSKKVNWFKNTATLLVITQLCYIGTTITFRLNVFVDL